MYCPKCGTEHNEKDKVCSKCGLELQSKNIIKRIFDRHERAAKLGIVPIAFIIIFIAIVVSNNANNKPISVAADNKTTEVIAEPSPTVEPSPTPIPTPISTPIPVVENNWQKTKDLTISKGIKFNEAKDGDVFRIKDLVSINKTLIVTLEGARTGIDELSFQDGKYYMIVDFSILNVSDKDYNSSIYDFTLSDALGYTYDPIITYNTTGSLEGNIKGPGIKRGEVAFEVLGNQRVFVLHYNTKAGLINSTKISESINFLMQVKTSSQNGTAPSPTINPSDG